MRALITVPWRPRRSYWRSACCLGDHRTLQNIEDLREQLVSEGAELDRKTLVVQRLPHGFGVCAGRSVKKGEVVASVPRRLVLEVPVSGHSRPSLKTLPFSAAAGGHGQWYDVMGFAEGRAAVTHAAARLIEEYLAGTGLCQTCKCFLAYVTGFHGSAQQVKYLHSGLTVRLYHPLWPCRRLYTH